MRIHKCRWLTAQAACISGGGGKTGMGVGGHSCYILTEFGYALYAKIPSEVGLKSNGVIGNLNTG